MDETSASDKVEQNMEKGLEKIVVEEDKTQGKKAEINSKGNFEDHRARDGNDTSLVSTRAHTQPKENDP
jgi:hypothetical protein